MVNTPEVRVRPSNESFLTWIERPYISHETRARLSTASALIVPREGYGERSDLLYFPTNTDDLLLFLQDAETDELRVDICIEDQDYQELALYADFISIAPMVVASGVMSLLVNLISDWVNRRAGKHAEHTEVRTTLIAHNSRTGDSLAFSYEGPASLYRESMSATLREHGYLAGQPPSTQGPSPALRD